jgi:isopentenyl phosphate kinase
MEKIILIKLGGSLITNKSKPLELRAEVLADLVSQVKKAWDETEDSIILAHGSGSFGHVPAEKYKTIDGKIHEQSVYGAAVVEDVASQLNRIVVGECLKQNLPAVSIRPFDVLHLDKGKVKRVDLDSLIHSLSLGFLPVLYGDVVLDLKTGFTIWSTEKVLNLLASEMKIRGMKVDKVIHCGETDGFLVKDKVVPEINLGNVMEMKKFVGTTKGFDVTGGMLHKVEEALITAEAGIDSYIIGGNHGGNLFRAIVGEEFIGTRIRI